MYACNYTKTAQGPGRKGAWCPYASRKIFKALNFITKFEIGIEPRFGWHVYVRRQFNTNYESQTNA